VNGLLFLFVLMPAMTGISIGMVKLAEITAKKFPKLAHYFEIGINLATAVVVLIMAWPYVLYQIFKAVHKRENVLKGRS